MDKPTTPETKEPMTKETEIEGQTDPKITAKPEQKHEQKNDRNEQKGDGRNEQKNDGRNEQKNEGRNEQKNDGRNDQKGDAKADGQKKVRVMTKDELERKFKSGSVQIVNVLEPKDYALGMIKGSKKIPLAALGKRFAELDKSKEVVTYCSGVDCSASHEAAEMLMGKGFNVAAYEGGAKEWKASGLPTE